MELFHDVIRGPYAFLLIVQILVVAFLLLTMIWLVIQRVKDGGRETAAPRLDKVAEAASTASAPVFAAGEPLLEAAAAVTEALGASGSPPTPMPAPTASGEPLMKASPGPSVEVLEAHEKEVKQLAEEGSALKDKIKYLESRLMEYEIVQEEISSLSELRVENEKLKEELMKTKVPGSPAPAAPSEVPTNPVMETVSKNQIDNILQKLDEITAKP